MFRKWVDFIFLLLSFTKKIANSVQYQVVMPFQESKRTFTPEYLLIRYEQNFSAYFHFAFSEKLIMQCKRKAIYISYEIVERVLKKVTSFSFYVKSCWTYMSI